MHFVHLRDVTLGDGGGICFSYALDELPLSLLVWGGAHEHERTHQTDQRHPDVA